MTPCAFVPPYLLERIVALHGDDATASCCRATLEVDTRLRQHRVETAGPAAGTAPGAVLRLAPDAGFTVHSAERTEQLPGRPVRSAGQPEVGDAAVDEAHDGTAAALALFAEEYQHSSYDGAGAPVSVTVHFGREYANAFWDGERLVLGDGDGRVFGRFTKPVDVLAHEFTHAVTQHTARLEYLDQPGALNESMSDVFAACLKQRLLGQLPHEADWLIGEGIFLATVRGRALRSMSAPGTAYDDPVLGTDPQVGSMADYVVTRQDYGGVHLNSGIPNRAFHLAAVALGGPAWEVPGRIWFAALTSGLGPRTDFAGFAAVTVAEAGRVSEAARSAVADAWAEVGVESQPGRAGGGVAPAGRAATTPAPSSPTSTPAAGRVAVLRSGGIAGLREQAEAVIGEDPRTSQIQQLLGRVDLDGAARSAGAAGSRPQPDRYVYTVRVDDREVVVAEQDLTPELSDLVHLLLDPR